MESCPRPFAGVDPCLDVEAARWLVERLHPLGHDVGAVLPEGFPAYVRIDHPDPDGVGTAHEGGLLVGDLEALAGVLTQFTGTPQECWFCLWDGYGDVTGAVAMYVVAGEVGDGPAARQRFEDTERRLQQDFAERKQAVAAVVARCGRIEAPGREYLLFKGPVTEVMAASTSGAGMGPTGPSVPRSASDPAAGLDGPNLWWPADRAWVVASEIDLPWTYVAGPAALADALVADPRFATSHTSPTDPITPT